MCRMSARWNLCKCCCGGKVDDRAPHFYCGCEASSNVKRSKLKMYGENLSAEDIDKQTLIFDGDESTTSDNNTEKREKDEWVVHNPSVGFESEFGDALEADRAIRIFGTVLSDAFSFTVNICRIIGKDMNIGFHINPRFDQQYIARNSKIDGKWGIEEAQSYCRFPFSRGEKFCIEIFTTHNEFMVAVNGLHYCAFYYRYPLFDLNRIEIFGNVSLQKILCVASKIYPCELPTSFLPKAHFLSVSSSGTKSQNSDPLDCVTPLVISLEERISAGTEIEICGRVKLLPHSFYVNLQRGKLNCPHPVINLHVNARFREKPNRGCCTILSNSWISGEWGSEQFASRDSYFFAGQSFRLKIKCQEDAFLLLNDGNTIMSFTHRSDFSRINTIFIVGDIFVHAVTFQ